MLRLSFFVAIILSNCAYQSCMSYVELRADMYQLSYVTCCSLRCDCVLCFRTFYSYNPSLLSCIVLPWLHIINDSIILSVRCKCRGEWMHICSSLHNRRWRRRVLRWWRRVRNLKVVSLSLADTLFLLVKISLKFLHPVLCLP